MAITTANHPGNFKTDAQTPRLPQTPHGRALRTTEWFLSGKPEKRDYDRATIRSLTSAV
ncbi:hypothetical protein [Kaarinaea lacus]